MAALLNELLFRVFIIGSLGIANIRLRRERRLLVDGNLCRVLSVPRTDE